MKLFLSSTYSHYFSPSLLLLLCITNWLWVGWELGDLEVKTEKNEKDGGTFVGRESGKVFPKTVWPNSKVGRLKGNRTKHGSLILDHNYFNNYFKIF